MLWIASLPVGDRDPRCRTWRCAARACAAATVLSVSLVAAAQTPPAAQGLHEELLALEFGIGVVQRGVLSTRREAIAPTPLAVLFPGSPAVVRPVVEGRAMVRSSIGGNFLVRARRHLIDDRIAVLIADCRSDQGDECSTAYQSSRQRYDDVARLIDAAKQRLPRLRQVWLIGSSLGTVSSA